MSIFKVNIEKTNLDNYFIETEKLLKFLCGINTKDFNTKFSYGILNDYGELKLFLEGEKDFLKLLMDKLSTIYPNSIYEEMNDYKPLFDKQSYFCKLKLMYDSKLKLTIEDMSDLLINNLINSIFKKDKDNKYNGLILTSFKPISSIKNEQKSIKNYLLKGTKFVLDSIFYNESKEIINKEERENQEERFKYSISIKIAISNQEETSINHMKNIAYNFCQLNDSNIFEIEEISKEEMFDNDYNIELSTSEAANLLCFPSSNFLTSIFGKHNTKNVIDIKVPNKGIIIGYNRNNSYAIPAPPKKINIYNYKNMYDDIQKIIENICKPKLCLGLQGAGKSEWMVNYAIQCLENGIPVILFDTKNDTQQRFIESVPEKYLDKIDYLDLGNIKYPMGLNLFRKRRKDDLTENSLITSTFISYMKKQFGSSWGFKIQQTIQMTCEAILLDSTPTLSEFYWMLTEKDYRDYIINIIDDLIKLPETKGKLQLKKLLKYWKKVNEMDQKILNKEFAPTLNKIGAFLDNRFINAIVSQTESYDFRKSGDLGRSTIINLPENVVSRENLQLLAGFINKSIWLDYQTRDDIDISERYPVAFIVDESHTLVDDEFFDILTKARSRRLAILLATQSLSNFDSRGNRYSNMINDNCKSKFLFKISYSDARTFSEEFDSISSTDLSDCKDYSFYCRLLLENGKVSKPCYLEAPPEAVKLREYDDFRKSRINTKLSIDDIENDIQNRFDKSTVINTLIGL